ncbi:hypothetical protein OnM2_057065, partial [Erysiphe neolycopersici]
EFSEGQGDSTPAIRKPHGRPRDILKSRPLSGGGGSFGIDINSSTCKSQLEKLPHTNTLQKLTDTNTNTNTNATNNLPIINTINTLPNANAKTVDTLLNLNTINTLPVTKNAKTIINTYSTKFHPIDSCYQKLGICESKTELTVPVIQAQNQDVNTSIILSTNIPEKIEKNLPISERSNQIKAQGQI